MRTKQMLHASLLCGALAVSATTTAVGEPLQIEVASANQSYDPRNEKPVVSVRMTAPSARAFAELTRTNVGRTVAIRIDGRVVMTPVIMEPIPSGMGQISGNFSVEQAREIAAGPASGASKMEMEIVPENGQGGPAGKAVK